MNINISIKEALRLGYASLKRDWPQWFGLSLILALIQLPSAFFATNGGDNIMPSPTEVAVLLLTFVLTMIISPGETQFGLNAARNKNVSIKLLTEKANLALKFALIFIVYGLVVGAGLILLIIPGIYLAIKYGLTPYLVLENPKLGVIEALKKSGELTKGKILPILSAGLLLLIIFIFLSIIASTLVGVIVEASTPTRSVIYTLIYSFPNSLINPIMIVGSAYIYYAVKKAKSAK